MLTIYREHDDLPLGWHPTLAHEGIKPNGNLENFTEIASFYDIEVQYCNDITKCDFVVFDLDRYHIYTNLNPCLLIREDIIDYCKETQLPVIMWHPGECHTANNPLTQFARNSLGLNVWWVDSNFRPILNKHLPFDSSEMWLKKDKIFNLNIKTPTNYNIYDFSFFVKRSEFHKHIIYNHLNNYANPTYMHYAEPEYIGSDARYQWAFSDEFDYCTVPDKATWLSRQEMYDIKQVSSVLLSINSYFVPTVNECETAPLYITEKFVEDLITNKPVMPIGHHGTVKYFIELGFEFPPWIEYQYDDIADHSRRIQKYLEAVNNLAKIDNLSELSVEFQNKSKNAELVRALTFKSQFIDICNKIKGL
jgi:hypothetical protein